MTSICKACGFAFLVRHLPIDPHQSPGCGLCRVDISWPTLGVCKRRTIKLPSGFPGIPRKWAGRRSISKNARWDRRQVRHLGATACSIAVGNNRKALYGSRAWVNTRRFSPHAAVLSETRVLSIRHGILVIARGISEEMRARPVRCSVRSKYNIINNSAGIGALESYPDDIPVGRCAAKRIASGGGCCCCKGDGQYS
jgi:hypothetical protein